MTAAAGGALGMGMLSEAHAEEPKVQKAEKSLRILILGGTAFTGPHQIKYALERGHEVTIFNRGRTEPTVHPELFDKVEKLVGDRDNDLASLEGREWDAVIDNSASRPRWVRQSAGLLKDAADIYLFTSSLSVHADFSKVGITEDDPVATIDAATAPTAGPTGPFASRAAERSWRPANPPTRPSISTRET
jgi:2'-hydroxyisoflavone reductase